MKRKHNVEPSESGPNKAGRLTSSATATVPRSALPSVVSADVSQIREDTASSPTDAAARRSQRSAKDQAADDQVSCPPSIYTFPIQRVPTLNNPFKVWQLTYQPVAYADVQKVIQNTIGDAPSITVLNQCRDRSARTLDPLDSRPWTLWRFGKYLDSRLQHLKETSHPTVEAGMMTAIEALLKVADRHVLQLFIAVFNLLPEHEKQALREIDAAKNKVEQKWLDFFLDK